MSQRPIEVSTRLPMREEHVPMDGKMPDGTGVPVYLGQPGPPPRPAVPKIGQVTEWEDCGDGHVLATLQMVLPPDMEDGAYQFGLNAIAVRSANGKHVESITRVTSVSLLPPDML